ncbi:MAG: ABC transporter ATP-binding protein/permease [Nitrospirota bacterium]|nr:ABC transporter ATP-binding protein/permease [Nitrospirota bacterium]
MHPLLRTLAYIHPYKGLAVIVLALAAATTLVELVPPWILKTVLDDVLPTKNSGIFVWLVAALAGAYFLRALSNMLRIRLNNHLEQRVVFDMRDHVYRRLQLLSLDYFEDNATGEIMSRVNNDVNNMERVFIDGVEQFMVATLTLIGVATMMFLLDWKLALLALCPIPLLILGGVFYTRRVHLLYTLIRRKLAVMNAQLQDNISGIREILSFNRQDHERARFAATSREYAEANLKVMRLWSMYSPSMLFTGALGTVLIVGFGGQRVMEGTLTSGTLVAMLFYLALFYTPVNQIHGINHMLQHALASCRRVFEIIDAQPQVADRADAITLPAPAEGTVHFETVTFRYRTEIPVLDEVSFDVAAGEHIALVGASGAGKSTCVKLLMRFYDVTDGRITLDGHDVRELTIATLRDQIALVSQDPFLFNGTVRENIQYGRLTATDEALYAAARAAQVDTFIRDLPQGYDTRIGERGIKLSGGERTRIAVARALLKNPPIVVLDEATASVDTATERLIQDAMQHLIEGRTTFIIAHRLSTLRTVDRILVLDQGRIVESGTHDELVAKNGAYAAIFETQIAI